MDEILATAEKKSLKRSLGAFQLTLLGIGAVITALGFTAWTSRSLIPSRSESRR